VRAKQRGRQKFVHLMAKTMISARDARLARAIFHSDAYFREVIKVIEKLQDVCLTFFKKYNSSATLAQLVGNANEQMRYLNARHLDFLPI